MTDSELVGYVRKSKAGKAIKINLMKEALMQAPTYKGKDGIEYLSLIINLGKIQKVLREQQTVTSVCYIVDEPEEG